MPLPEPLLLVRAPYGREPLGGAGKGRPLHALQRWDAVLLALMPAAHACKQRSGRGWGAAQLP